MPLNSAKLVILTIILRDLILTACKKTLAVVCSYTVEVDVRPSQSLNNEVGALQPPATVGALEIAVHRLNDNQKEKRCCILHCLFYSKIWAPIYTLP